MAYSCETEELESLREQVISLNRERAELTLALKDLFAPPCGSPGVDRIEMAKAWHRASALLQSITERGE